MKIFSVKPGKNGIKEGRASLARPLLGLLGLCIFSLTVMRPHRKRRHFFYRNLFENANEAMYLVDPNGWTIIDINRRGEKLTGYSKAGIRGLKVSKLLPFDPVQAKQTFEEAITKGFTQTVSCFQLRKQDGSVATVELAASTIPDNGRPLVQVIIHDVTHHIEAKHEQQRALRELEAINETTLQLTSSLEMPDVLHNVIEQATKLLEGNAGVIGVYDQRLQKLTNFEVYGLPEAIKEQNKELIQVSFEVVELSQKPTIINDYQSRGRFSPLVEYGVQALIAAPFLFDKEVLGAVAVMSTSPTRKFNEHDASLLSTISHPTAIAVQNARLFSKVRASERELLERAQDLEKLSAVTLEITSLLNLDDLLAKIAEHAAEFSGADAGFAGVIDRQSGRIEALSSYKLPEETIASCTKVANDMVKNSVRLRTTIQEASTNIKDVASQSSPRGFLLVPVLTNGKVTAVIGVCFLSSDKVIDEYHQSLIEAIATKASVAIEHAVLHKQLQESLGTSHILLKASETIGRSLDIKETLNELVNAAVKSTGLDHSNIGMFDPAHEELVMATSYGALLPVGMRFQLFKECPEAMKLTNGTLVVADKSDPSISPEFHNFLDRIKTESALVMPLMRGNVLLGVMCFGSRYTHHFTNHEIEIAKGIAGQATIAIQNAQLYMQTKTELERERHIAEALQRSLLPMKLPPIKNTELGAFYESSTKEAQVGGDFYDVIALPNNKYAISIGDVSGKGIEAAAATAMVKCIIRTFLYQYPSPGFALSQANSSLSRQLGKSTFVTVFCAVYDYETGQIVYTNAGHPHPCHFDSQKNGCFQLPSADPALCLLTNYNYHEQVAHMSPGSMLVTFTDGTTEARRGHEFFGEERLISVIEKSAAKSAQGVADAIIQACLEFAEGKLEDDIAILVLKHR
ncbi:MAG TPA: SpoIIE family protein phosphatase [Candidatus Aquicultor sp.]|jgi:PAS domain S-box-containing protein